MATFISLVNWTDQGISQFGDTVHRAEAFESMLREAGGSLHHMWWTVGSYDMIAVADAPDVETLTACLLKAGSLGNVRTNTLQAFDRAAFSSIVDRAR